MKATGPSEGAILGQVALGYSPFIDRRRAVTATRLTVFPLRPDAVLDVGQLLHEVGNVWPASGARDSLNIASERLLAELMLARPSANLMVEVPAFMAVDPANIEPLRTLHAGGSTLLLKGRPLQPLPREVLPCFRSAIVDIAEDRRVLDPVIPAGVQRAIGHIQSGVRTVAEMEAAFARGAEAVLGWPIDDAVTHAAAHRGHAVAAPAMQAIVELIRQADREESIEKLEATLKRDPALAFKLLRYINSPAFGLRVEIGSFRHAIMMLGYRRLKRWLALLLATASKDVNLRPVMFAAVRRGMMMEELVRHLGDDEMRNELFICGVFSLLDRMFQQPFATLLESIPVPERVHQALVEGRGPHLPYLQLVQAIEGEALYELRDAADRLMMSVAEINRAELRALGAASELE